VLGDYSIGDLGSIFVMQGFCRPDLFSVYVLMGARLGSSSARWASSTWPMRVHDPRRLRDLDDIEHLPALFAVAVSPATSFSQ